MVDPSWKGPLCKARRPCALRRHLKLGVRPAARRTVCACERESGNRLFFRFRLRRVFAAWCICFFQVRSQRRFRLAFFALRFGADMTPAKVTLINRQST